MNGLARVIDFVLLPIIAGGFTFAVTLNFHPRYDLALESAAVGAFVMLVFMVARLPRRMIARILRRQAKPKASGALSVADLPPEQQNRISGIEERLRTPYGTPTIRVVEDRAARPRPRDS